MKWNDGLWHDWFDKSRSWWSGPESAGQIKNKERVSQRAFPITHLMLRVINTVKPEAAGWTLTAITYTTLSSRHIKTTHVRVREQWTVCSQSGEVRQLLTHCWVTCREQTPTVCQRLILFLFAGSCHQTFTVSLVLIMEPPEVQFFIRASSWTQFDVVLYNILWSW